jgi:predicted Zn-dependent peptidase
VLLACFFAFAISCFSQQAPLLDTLTLKNGLKVYLIRFGEDSVFNVRLVIKGGKKNENPCQVGYNRLIQQVLRETLEEKQNSLSEKKNRLAYEIHEGYTALSANYSSKDFDKEMNLLGAAILNLSFTKDKIDKAVSTAINYYTPENMSSSQLADVFRDLYLYGSDDPLGRNYCQYQLQKVLPEELFRFYSEHYTPNKVSLLICGNFNINEIERKVLDAFGKWKPSNKENNGIYEIETKTPRIKNREINFVNKYNLKECRLKMLQSAPSVRSPDYPAFLVVFNLFNHHLLDQVKDKDLMNVDTANFEPVNYANGFIEVNLVVKLSEMSDAIKLVDITLQSFNKSNFTEAELNEVVKDLKDNLMKVNTPEGILSFYNPLIHNFYSRLNYFNNLSNVKVQDLQMILKKYFLPEAYKLIVIGEENVLSGQLRVLNNINKYQTLDFETCDETCRDPLVATKKKKGNHYQEPRWWCPNCWKRVILGKR